MRTTFLIAMVVAAQVALVSCADDDTPAPGSSAGRDQRSAPVGWSRAGDFVAEPAYADGVVLALRREGTAIRLEALDGRSGGVRWSRPWSPGVGEDRALYVSVFTARSGRKVAVVPVPLSRAARSATPSSGESKERLEVRDLRTGALVSRTGFLELDSTPVSCPDEKDACLDLRRGASVLDLDTGVIRSESDALPDSAFWADENHTVYTTYPPDAQIGVVNGRDVVWRRALAEVTDASTGDRFAVVDFHRQKRAHRLLGAVTKPIEEDREDRFTQGKGLVSRFQGAKMFAVDDRDGSLLWKAPGQFGCLPSRREAPFYKVRCEFAGRVDIPRGVDGMQRSIDVTVKVSGFDPATGRSTWSVELSSARVDLAFAGRPPLATDAHHVPLQTTRDRGLLDVRNGHLSPVAADAVFACPVGRRVERFLPAYETDDGTPHERRIVTSGHRPCRIDGSTDGVRWTRAAIEDAGIAGGKGRVLVVEGNGLRSYRTG